MPPTPFVELRSILADEHDEFPDIRVIIKFRQRKITKFSREMTVYK